MKVTAETDLIRGLIKDVIVLAKLRWQLLGNNLWNRDLLCFPHHFYILLSLLNSSPSHESGSWAWSMSPHCASEYLY